MRGKCDSRADLSIDLHLALHLQRRLNADYALDFLGQNWPVTPAGQKIVTLVHHPEQRFWSIPHPPSHTQPTWPNVFAHHRL